MMFAFGSKDWGISGISGRDHFLIGISSEWWDAGKQQQSCVSSSPSNATKQKKKSNNYY